MPISAAYSFAVRPLSPQRSTRFAHSSRDVRSIVASATENYESSGRTSGTRLVERIPISRQTWQSMLEGLARGLYRVMHERPNWTPVFAYHTGPASAGLGFIDESVRLMLEDGLALQDAFSAYWCAMSFAVGSALCERTMMGAGDGCARLLDRLRELPVRAPGQHATLAAAAPKLIGWSWDDAFERGLRSLLAGIEARRARPKAAPKRRARALRTSA